MKIKTIMIVMTLICMDLTYPFYVVSTRLVSGLFIVFDTNLLTHPVACDIIIVEIKEVVYTRFLSFEFSKRCAAE